MRVFERKKNLIYLGMLEFFDIFVLQVVKFNLHSIHLSYTNKLSNLHNLIRFYPGNVINKKLIEREVFYHQQTGFMGLMICKFGQELSFLLLL